VDNLLNPVTPVHVTSSLSTALSSQLSLVTPVHVTSYLSTALSSDLCLYLPNGVISFKCFGSTFVVISHRYIVCCMFYPTFQSINFNRLGRTYSMITLKSLSSLGATALRESWLPVLFASTGLYPELSFSILQSPSLVGSLERR
jgi:hypothetical protein